MSANQLNDFQRHFVVEAKRIAPVVRYEEGSIPQQQWKFGQGVFSKVQNSSHGFSKWSRGSVVPIVRTTTWDPTICEKCGAPMSEPHQLGPRWVNRCTRCGLTRDVPTSTPLLQQQRQNWPPYPEALTDVGHERPWVAVGKVADVVQADYYHVAPTADRARIKQHGLQPSSPAHNDRWWEPGYDEKTGEDLPGEPPRWLRNQPTGVYVMKDPDRARGLWAYDQLTDYDRGQEAWDTWRVPSDRVQQTERDPVMGDPKIGEGVVIPHPVYPELHAGGPEEFGPWPERKPPPDFEDLPYEKQEDWWDRTSAHAIYQPTHECPHCRQPFVDNGWTGYTPFNDGGYGDRTWQCPGCGSDLHEIHNRPQTRVISPQDQSQ